MFDEAIVKDWVTTQHPNKPPQQQNLKKTCKKNSKIQHQTNTQTYNKQKYYNRKQKQTNLWFSRTNHNMTPTAYHKSGTCILNSWKWDFGGLESVVVKPQTNTKPTKKKQQKNAKQLNATLTYIQTIMDPEISLTRVHTF